VETGHETIWLKLTDGLPSTVETEISVDWSAFLGIREQGPSKKREGAGGRSSDHEQTSARLGNAGKKGFFDLHGRRILAA